MKNIYIILTQSGTGVSKVLKMITKEKYNHSSICIDEDFNKFYSFGRIYTNHILPGGFIEENAFTHVFGEFEKVPCLILKKEVSDKQYDNLKNIIDNFIQNKENLSYAVLGLTLANTHVSVTKSNKFFCSQFVAKVLNDIHIDTPKRPEHMHPMDFTQIDSVEKVYEGELKEFCRDKEKLLNV